MTTDRIKEIQQQTAFPDSVSVQQALLQVWNECQQENNKEIEELTRSRDDVFHELEGTKEHNKQLQEEIERLKGDSKEVNDKEIDAFINNYINALPDGWNSRLDMILSMKNAMIEALSYKEKYLTNH
jgi:hypothetical protein